MKNFDLKEIYSRIRLIFDSDPLKIDPNPKRDWTILFILFSLSIIVSAGVHYYLYNYFQNLSQDKQAIQVKNIKTVSHEEIEKVISRYRERETIFNLLLNERPVYKDPSQ